jgi:hypothetical protein
MGKRKHNAKDTAVRKEKDMLDGEKERWTRVGGEGRKDEAERDGEYKQNKKQQGRVSEPLFFLRALAKQFSQWAKRCQPRQKGRMSVVFACGPPLAPLREPTPVHPCRL